MAPGSSAERGASHHPPNGKVVAAKVPGTPRKEVSRSRERMGAVQDPGLNDYVRFEGPICSPCPCRTAPGCGVAMDCEMVPPQPFSEHLS